MSQTQEFIQQWYKDKPQDDYILLWTIDHAGKKQSYWYQDCNQIANAVSLMTTRNVYVGMGTSAKDYGEKLRAKESQIIGIPGLWCDIDYGNEGHTKTNNPPSLDDARSLLSDMPLQPTMIVSSGHGLHAYWQFDTWFPIALDADRVKAKALETRWLALLSERAKARGWQVDSVQDLPRVLRIPGSINNKTSDPLPCDLITLSPDNRYSIATIEAAIPASIPTVAKPIRSTISNKIAPDSHITIPTGIIKLDHERMERLLDDKKFTRSLERKRTDLKDTSDSAYEMSLVNFALMDGWSDQETVNLCIYWRKKHGLAIDKHPVEYYTRTLQNVHNDILAKIADDNKLETIKEIAKNTISDMSDEERATRLTYLRDILEIPITRVVMLNSDPHEYSIETEIGVIKMGDVDNLMSFTRCNNRIADSIKRSLPTKIKKSWDDVRMLLITTRVEIEMQDATHIGTMQAWLSQYFRDKAIEDTDISAVFDHETPVITNKGVYMAINDFVNWCQSGRISEKPTRQQLCSWLRDCKGETVFIHHPNDNKNKKRLWIVPQI